VYADTGGRTKGRKPPGRNFVPTTRPLPSRTRVNFDRITPTTSDRPPDSSTMWTEGCGTVSATRGWGSSQRTTQ
jgi:hypothetical protein